jgi:hypothetical protein
MVTTKTTTTAALHSLSASRIATPMWQTPNAATAVPATRLITGAAAGYANGGFAAQAVVADKHSRQAKPAAPPRGSR